MDASIYHSPAWAVARAAALVRDGQRCTVSRLLGGPCRGPLHVHHITPLSEGGSHALDNLGTACAYHHPTWEALRKALELARRPRRCHHRHTSAEARRICEARRRSP